MDVFSSSIAPGVSAPQACGLQTWHVIPLLRLIAQSGKVLSFDIAELAPPYDRDKQTASLAARLLWEYLHYRSDK